MVRRHQFDGGAAHHARAVELAAIQQHLCEASDLGPAKHAGSSTPNGAAKSLAGDEEGQDRCHGQAPGGDVMFNNIGALMPSIRAVRKETELGPWTQPAQGERASSLIISGAWPTRAEKANLRIVVRIMVVILFSSGAGMAFPWSRENLF
jgi:hypothetical protein